MRAAGRPVAVAINIGVLDLAQFAGQMEKHERIKLCHNDFQSNVLINNRTSIFESKMAIVSSSLSNFCSGVIRAGE